MKKTLLCAFVLALSLPLALIAQRRQPDYGRGPRRDDDDRRSRVVRVVADLERRTNEFQVALRRALDHSELDRSRREDELNRDANRLEHAANRLRESWNAERDFERSRQHLSVALNAGKDINRTMARHRLRGHVQAEWNAVRRELNLLAEVFHEPPIRWE